MKIRFVFRIFQNWLPHIDSHELNVKIHIYCICSFLLSHSQIFPRSLNISGNTLLHKEEKKVYIFQDATTIHFFFYFLFRKKMLSGLALTTPLPDVRYSFGVKSDDDHRSNLTTTVNSFSFSYFSPDVYAMRLSFILFATLSQLLLHGESKECKLFKKC